MSQDIEKIVIKSIVEIARAKGFYAHIIQQFQRIHVKSPHKIKTAAVGRMPNSSYVKLYINDDYFEKIISESKDYVLGAIEHEIIHIALGHLFLEFDDHKRGNVALDCVVNSYISSDKIHDTWIHPNNFGFPLRMSAKWYYDRLKDNSNYQEMLNDLNPTSQDSYNKIENCNISHTLWDNIKNDDLIENFIKDILNKSKEFCNGDYGDIHGDIIESIEDYMSHKKSILPWNNLLRKFVASNYSDILSYTKKRISKRFGTRPGVKKEDVLNLGIIIDTSGSMSLNQIEKFWNEIYWIHRNNVNIWTYDCDCEIQGPFRYNGKWDGKVHGRGGTDFQVALDQVSKKNYDAIIYFTDGCALEVEKKYKIPILFCLTTDLDENDYPYKWGRTIKMLNI